MAGKLSRSVPLGFFIRDFFKSLQDLKTNIHITKSPAMLKRVTTNVRHRFTQCMENDHHSQSPIRFHLKKYINKNIIKINKYFPIPTIVFIEPFD